MIKDWEIENRLEKWVQLSTWSFTWMILLTNIWRTSKVIIFRSLLFVGSWFHRKECFWQRSLPGMSAAWKIDTWMPAFWESRGREGAFHAHSVEAFTSARWTQDKAGKKSRNREKKKIRSIALSLILSKELKSRTWARVWKELSSSTWWEGRDLRFHSLFILATSSIPVITWSFWAFWGFRSINQGVSQLFPALL